MQPGEHQDAAQDSALMDAPSSGLTPGDAPMSGTYDGGGFADPAAAPAAPAPADDPVAPAAAPAPVAAAAPADDVLTAVPDDLINIKQQALQQLSPLVGHLEQTPEEKFRTTMMMIQASDNSELIKDAYAAAQQIPDEKSRAQALLDVVNEINYFTQHHDQQQ
ncbi:MAG TPA: hypothetical protein VLH86_01270 [Patescibacteria group bacterium]|nr:hypothetical protein [Patescibacteria group bacterium]